MTGSGSGIGAATRARLEAAGHEVLGVDLRGQEVDADLSTPAGRTAAVQAILDWCGGTLDGFVGCAGVGPQVEPPREMDDGNTVRSWVDRYLHPYPPALRRHSGSTYPIPSNC